MYKILLFFFKFTNIFNLQDNGLHCPRLLNFFIDVSDKKRTYLRSCDHKMNGHSSQIWQNLYFSHYFNKKYQIS